MRAKLINDNWKYYETRNAFAMRGAEENTKAVTLPHDAMMEHPAYEESVNGYVTAFRDGHVGHYKRTLSVPESWREKTNLLKFEGVYMDASVFINGEFAGRCHYGYNTFYIRLDPHLKYGADNEIHVLVNNSGMANSRWYSGGGIYRDVYLVQGGKVYFKEDCFRIKTEAADDDLAILCVSYTLRSRLSERLPAEVRMTVRDGSGRIMNETVCPIGFFDAGEKTWRTRLTVDHPKLWDEDHPDLYTITGELLIDGEVIDTAEETFGIRTITIDPKRGLRVNKKTVKLRGGCIHHDAGIIGAVSYEDAEVRRMTMMKEAGFNAIRMAHHPASQTLLRVCDRLGIYVMDESFDMWYKSKNDFDYSRVFADDWRYTLKMLALKDYNHPSVIMYSLGNEIPESGNPDGIEITHEMCEEIKKYDDTRFVTQGINGVFTAGDNMPAILQDVMDEVNADNIEQVNDFMTIMQNHLPRIMQHPLISERLKKMDQTMDLLGYNYMASRYVQDASEAPNRVIFGSETYAPAIRKEWDIIERQPNVIGEFCWAAWDYLGEAGVGALLYEGEERLPKWPMQLAYIGDFDITGFRRPVSYLREIVFKKLHKPYIAVQEPAHYGEVKVIGPWTLSDARSCWNFEGFEGKPTVVEVYSAAPEVELFVNGKSQGRKPCGPAHAYLAEFTCLYEPGTVKAVSLENGQETGSYELHSAAGKRLLFTEKEKDWGKELIFINFSVRDAKGVPDADCFKDLSISVTGAELLGFGTGDDRPLHDYKESTTTLFQGRAQAILKRIPGEEILRIMTKFDGEEQEWVFPLQSTGNC